MKKLFLAIAAMFLLFAISSPAWGQRQWPEFDPNPSPTTPPFHATVNDGSGGHWAFNYDWGRVLLMRPSSKSRSILVGTNGPLYFNEKLKFDERSLPPTAGIALAFYGYLAELNKKRKSTTVTLWINPDTGEINEVAFMFILKGYDDAILSVPPRIFSLYEDILKKTVKFEIPYGIFDLENTKGYGNIKPENGIFYQFDIKFPAPAEGEPDFLALQANQIGL